MVTPFSISAEGLSSDYYIMSSDITSKSPQSVKTRIVGGFIIDIFLSQKCDIINPFNKRLGAKMPSAQPVIHPNTQSANGAENEI
jgi:hypothetical protein